MVTEKKERVKNPKTTVLYQKLGDRWYVFTTEENDQVLYSSLPKGIHPIKNKLELFKLKIEAKTSELKKEKKLKTENATYLDEARECIPSTDIPKSTKPEKKSKESRPTIRQVIAEEEPIL